jgi:hypothetical protein
MLRRSIEGSLKEDALRKIAILHKFRLECDARTTPTTDALVVVGVVTVKTFPLASFTDEIVPQFELFIKLMPTTTRSPACGAVANVDVIEFPVVHVVCTPFWARENEAACAIGASNRPNPARRK